MKNRPPIVDGLFYPFLVGKKKHGIQCSYLVFCVDAMWVSFNTIPLCASRGSAKLGVIYIVTQASMWVCIFSVVSIGRMMDGPNVLIPRILQKSCLSWGHFTMLCFVLSTVADTWKITRNHLWVVLFDHILIYDRCCTSTTVATAKQQETSGKPCRSPLWGLNPHDSMAKLFYSYFFVA